MVKSAEREVLHVLLEELYLCGLISKSAYLKGEDLAHSMTECPTFFADRECVTEKEGGAGEHPENTQ